MKENKEFYVGWQDDMPPKNGAFIKKILIPLFILIPLLTLMVVQLQKPFNEHEFELGSIKEFTGIYYQKPVPMLIANPGSLPDSLSSSILLVGYGKFGAEGIMEAIENEKGSLDGKKITLKGTLIYGDDRTLIELTEKENSLIGIDEQPAVSGRTEKSNTEIQLAGEILDPKCYFGVMKPGEGKIHRSCAIRCISGGIPPVFRSLSEMEGRQYDYYILLGDEGQKINKDVLENVGRPVVISGTTTQQNGWNILYATVGDISIAPPL